MQAEAAPSFSNKSYLLPRINREGFRFGWIAVAVAALAFAGAIAIMCVASEDFVVCHALTLGSSIWSTLVAMLATCLALLAYGVFLFFRDPDRYPPEDEKAILSPADGRICLIQDCPLPDAFGEMPEYRGRLFKRVSVFMSVFNVHVNRMPTAGEIVSKDYIAAGKFFNASLDKASKENERCNYLVRADNGTVYGVTQIAGLVARRIVPQVEAGQRLGRAERFGLIRFGSRLDVYLPANSTCCVRVGQTMVAGETTLARFDD